MTKQSDYKVEDTRGEHREIARKNMEIKFLCTLSFMNAIISNTKMNILFKQVKFL